VKIDVCLALCSGTSKALRFHGFGTRGAYQLVIRTFAILDKKKKPTSFFKRHFYLMDTPRSLDVIVEIGH
jgi:hypothetical protein